MDSDRSLRAAHAKSILAQHITKKLNLIPGKNYLGLPPAPAPPNKFLKEGPYKGRICIIGAGTTGLYMAMMLKYVGITNVDVLEASHRIGGRCFTHHLPGHDDIEHPYYDIGAMRIPDIPWMKSVIDFIPRLGLELKSYIYKNDKAPVSYYYRHKPAGSDKFTAFMTDVLNEFDFKDNFDQAFEKWISGTDNDNYSTKGFLMAGPQSNGAPNPHFTYQDVAEAELSDTSTGLFDQSFTETVIDYVDFAKAETAKWFRVEGGMQKVTDAMEERLLSSTWPNPDSAAIKVTKSSPVVAMSDNATTNKIEVTVAGQTSSEAYDMVFNTTAMGPLQKMDLQGLALPDPILQGIRTLGYDRSTKVAIRFSKPWWHLNKNPESQYGGVSSSDLPISNVVYPSWNEGPDKSAVLMVSYTWAQDATRMASMVPDYNVVTPKKSDAIVTLCLQNLVKLWSGASNPPTFEMLWDMYVSHHAWAWSHDLWTGGAFALFGPGQFKNLYPEFRKHFCKGKFAICGEALSAHHAWISGSFASAYQNVIMFLRQNYRMDDADALLNSFFGDGEGMHVQEMDMNQMDWTILLSDGRPQGWGEDYDVEG